MLYDDMDVDSEPTLVEIHLQSILENSEVYLICSIKADLSDLTHSSAVAAFEKAWLKQAYAPLTLLFDMALLTLHAPGLAQDQCASWIYDDHLSSLARHSYEAGTPVIFNTNPRPVASPTPTIHLMAVLIAGCLWIAHSWRSCTPTLCRGMPRNTYHLPPSSFARSFSYPLDSITPTLSINTFFNGKCPIIANTYSFATISAATWPGE